MTLVQQTTIYRTLDHKHNITRHRIIDTVETCPVKIAFGWSAIADFYYMYKIYRE